MPSKIRVFVSSTMKDLANERDAVVNRITEFNFEPVNAESWLPNGSKSWDRIHQEILSSHLFVLIGGERYGWIPDEGPGATGGQSVTQMEASAARAANIPILTFLKRLDYDCDRNSEDAKKRDAFRKEIEAWSTGLFVKKFDLAADLAAQVGAALVGALSESYLNTEVQRRSMFTVPVLGYTQADQERVYLSLDPFLVDLVRSQRAVLLAGAGMSMGAGFPSARALVELLVSTTVEYGDDFSGAALSGTFQEVAEGFELAYGRDVLLEVIRKALSAPQGVSATRAHHLSVRLFKVIITTNFDRLFELACEQAGIPYTVIFEDDEIPMISERTLIVKIDGSISAPESLVLTARDALSLREAKPRLWQSLEALMSKSPLVIVGHSLRDLNSKALLRSRGAGIPSYIVAPNIGSFDERRYTRQGFRIVKAVADNFFDSIASATDSSRKRT